MISAVLADDHIVVRTGIKMLLDADPDIEVVAEAAEGTEAYSLVARYKPDVLLLDISMPPGQSGKRRTDLREDPAHPCHGCSTTAEAAPRSDSPAASGKVPYSCSAGTSADRRAGYL